MTTTGHRHRGAPHARLSMRTTRLLVAVMAMVVIAAIAVLRQG